MTISVDVFPLDFNLRLSPLAAFGIRGSNVVEVGATLAARVRKMREVPCAWVKTERIVVAPSTFTLNDLRSVLSEIWSMQLTGFDQVEDVFQVEGWQASANAISQFVAVGVLSKGKNFVNSKYKSEIYPKPDLIVDEEILANKGVFVKREAVWRGVIVHGQPAIQISMRSPISSNKKLEDFLDPRNPKSINGRTVKCKETTGKVEDIVGTLGQRRQILKAYKPTDYDANILEPGHLSDNSPVVRIKPLFGKKTYDYPISVLEMVVEEELWLNTKAG